MSSFHKTVNNILARNVFQLYVAWLAAIIMLHKANSILGVTMEQCKISQMVNMQQTKDVWGFLLGEAFWLQEIVLKVYEDIHLPTGCQPSHQWHPVICSFFPIIFSKGVFSMCYYGLSNLCLEIQVYYLNLRGFYLYLKFSLGGLESKKLILRKKLSIWRSVSCFLSCFAALHLHSYLLDLWSIQKSTDI